MVDASVWATSLLGVVIRHVFCGLFFLFFYSQLCYPLRFQNSPQTCQWKGFLMFGNLFFYNSLLGRISIPNSFVSLFIFYIFSYLHSKTIGCLSGCLVSSASIQKLLWNLLSIQMFFWWICGGENDLPILFLCHLRLEICLCFWICCRGWS